MITNASLSNFRTTYCLLWLSTQQSSVPSLVHWCQSALKLNVTLLQHSLDAGTHFLLLCPPVVPPGCHCGFIYKNFLPANEDKNVNVTVTADIQFPASVGLWRPAEAPQQQQNNTRPGWREKTGCPQQRFADNLWINSFLSLAWATKTLLISTRNTMLNQ